MNKRFALLTACIFFLQCCIGQQPGAVAYTDISKISLADTMLRKSEFGFLAKNKILQTAYREINPAVTTSLYSHHINAPYVKYDVIATFHLCNTDSKERGVYFFPGLFYNDIELFNLQSNGTVVPLPDRKPDEPDSLGYRLIRIAPGDSVTVIARIQQVKTYNNNYFPRLINENYLASYIRNLKLVTRTEDNFTFLFCGLLLMMILFSMANYIQGSNSDFLYYGLYAFFIGAMLFIKSLYSFSTTYFNYYNESYLDFIMQNTGHLFYIIFMKRFLLTRENHPVLHKLFNAGIGFIVASLILFSVFHFFTPDYSPEHAVEMGSKYGLVLINIIFLIYSITRWKDRQMRYLFWGNLALLIFSVFSVALIAFIPKSKDLLSLFNSSLFYYEVGLFLELVFFLMALSYKSRRQIIEQTKERERLRAENEKKEIEKQLAVYKAQQEERNRISADMHDELGSGMTAIRLMSEIAKNKMKENTPKELDKISDSANDVLNKMNAIIWSMNSGNDSVGNLVAYIRAYSIEYMENTEMLCRVKIPDNIPEIEVTGDKRRNIFLCVKETLNNILKHSRATEVTIDILLHKDLVIKIRDNGVGIDMEKLRQFGNGLKNITRRMEMIGGTYKIENDKGTVTTLSLPLY